MVGFACSDFAARKRRVLDDLQHNTNDLSPKGSVDAPISSLVSLINSTADFYTTSTCSGRLSIFQHDDPQHPKTGRWLLVEHQQVTAEQVREAIRRGLSSQCEEKEELKEVEGGKASSHAVLKFEPFIVSVACRSLASASALLAVAVQSGCRESGIAGLHLPTAKHGDGQRDAGQLPSSLPQPVLLSVRSSIRLEVPVLHEGRLLVSDAFVDHCVQQANDKFTRNWTRLGVFEAQFRCAFLSAQDEVPASGPRSSPFGVDDGPRLTAEAGVVSSAAPSQPTTSASVALRSRLSQLEADLAALQVQLQTAHGSARALSPSSPSTSSMSAAVECQAEPTAEGEREEGRCWAVVVPRAQAKAVRSACKERDYNDTRRKVTAVDSTVVQLLRAAALPSEDGDGEVARTSEEGYVALPIEESVARLFHGLLAAADGHQRLLSHLGLAFPSSSPFPVWLHFARCPVLSFVVSPHQLLSRSIRRMCEEQQMTLPSSLLSALPQRWEQLGDLILLPSDAFTSSAWTAWLSSLSSSQLLSFHASVAAAFRCRRVARQQAVQVGLKRRSAVQLLLGDDGRVEHRENGVVFAFDVRLSMFSSGNGSEKQRLIHLVSAAIQRPSLPSHSSHYVVLDLYAGMGYFSLPLLVHTSVAHVHCCEFNDDTFAALQRSLTRNAIDPSRVTLHPGDNRRVELRRTLRGSVDRVLLGLLPSSEDGYETALSSLRDAGGWLHIHGNVAAAQRKEWVDGVVGRLSALLQRDVDERRRRWTVRAEKVEKVKSFAPFVDHLVLDVLLVPSLGHPTTPIASSSSLRPSTTISAPWPPSSTSSSPTPSSFSSSVPPSPFSYRSDGCAVHHKPSASDFWSSIYPGAAPALLTGLDVGDLSRFTPRALLTLPPSSCPPVTVHVCPLPSGRMDFTSKSGFSYRTLPFHELIGRLVASSPTSPSHELRDAYFVSPHERYYLRSLGADPRREAADFFSAFPALAAHLRLPFSLSSAVVPHSSVFRVSSPGLSLWTHFDVVDNLLVHLHGVKRVTLFPPSHCQDLYLPAVPHSSSSPVIDLYTPDLHRFPRFTAAQRAACQLTLHPGDVLFIPALWFHHVETVGDDVGVSVNVFWRGLAEDCYTPNDVYGNKDCRGGVAAMQAAEEAVRHTEALPPAFRDFYRRRAMGVLEQALHGG